MRKEGAADRARGTMKHLLGILAAGLAYLVFVRTTGLSIPCPVRLVTGYQCPGCGITRVFVALSRGDAAGAYAANPLVTILLPPGALYGLFSLVRYIRTGRRQGSTPENIALVLVLAITVAFGILRNLP